MTTREKGTGIHRWLILGLIVLAVIMGSLIPPIKPPVFLPGEPITEPLFNIAGQPFAITNTLLTTWFLYGILILVALGVRRTVGKTAAPRGIASIFEPIVEALQNLSESTAGSQWAKRFLPWVGGIILVVLFANLLKLVPGFESIGLLHEAHGEEDIRPNRSSRACIIFTSLKMTLQSRKALHRSKASRMNTCMKWCPFSGVLQPT